MFEFDDEVQRGVLRHMRDDHADDGLAMVRGLTDADDATEAEPVRVGPEGMTFRIVGPSGEQERTIAWDREIRERSDIRAAVTALHASAVGGGRRSGGGSFGDASH